MSQQDTITHGVVKVNYRTVDLSSVTQYSYIKKSGVVGEINSLFLGERMNVES